MTNITPEIYIQKDLNGKYTIENAEKAYNNYLSDNKTSKYTPKNIHLIGLVYSKADMVFLNEEKQYQKNDFDTLAIRNNKCLFEIDIKGGLFCFIDILSDIKCDYENFILVDGIRLETKDLILPLCALLLYRVKLCVIAPVDLDVITISYKSWMIENNIRRIYQNSSIITSRYKILSGKIFVPEMELLPNISQHLSPYKYILNTHQDILDISEHILSNYKRVFIQDILTDTTPERDNQEIYPKNIASLALDKYGYSIVSYTENTDYKFINPKLDDDSNFYTLKIYVDSQYSNIITDIKCNFPDTTVNINNTSFPIDSLVIPCSWLCYNPVYIYVKVPKNQKEELVKISMTHHFLNQQLLKQILNSPVNSTGIKCRQGMLVSD